MLLKQIHKPLDLINENKPKFGKILEYVHKMPGPINLLVWIISLYSLASSFQNAFGDKSFFDDRSWPDEKCDYKSSPRWWGCGGPLPIRKSRSIQVMWFMRIALWRIPHKLGEKSEGNNPPQNKLINENRWMHGKINRSMWTPNKHWWIS